MKKYKVDFEKSCGTVPAVIQDINTGEILMLAYVNEEAFTLTQTTGYTLLLKVTQIGDAACHEGYRSCFFRRIEGEESVIETTPLVNPSDIYRD